MEDKKNAALKIQKRWRKYQGAKEACPICMKIIGEDNSITECGHRFCTGCLLKSVQINGSCPLCRKELVEVKSDNDVDDEYWYMHGYNAGYDDGRQREAELNCQNQEEIEIAKQQSYDKGIISGRSAANEDLRKLRESQKVILAGLHEANSEIKLLREKNEEVENIKKNNRDILRGHQMIYSELQDDLNKKDEEIKRLTDRLNILMRNPFVEKLYRENVI